MMWSYEEFEEYLGAYWSAANARGNLLLKVFFAFFGIAIGSVVLVVTCVLPKSIGIAIEVAVLIGFGLLAAYVLATARTFHKAHCVVCVYCGCSLLALGEELEYLVEDGEERPDVLECPKCHRVVVKNDR